MKKKYIFWGALSIIALVVILFATTNLSLEFKKYFSPKFQNVERKVFEETQSYNHGMTQDLANYYEQYSDADEDGKEIIKNLIKFKFSDFNENNIRNEKLKTFLTNTRGY